MSDRAEHKEYRAVRTIRLTPGISVPWFVHCPDALCSQTFERGFHISPVVQPDNRLALLIRIVVDALPLKSGERGLKLCFLENVNQFHTFEGYKKHDGRETGVLNKYPQTQIATISHFAR
jgi:hypothetical protein